MPNKQKPAVAVAPASEDFTELVNLLSIYTEASNQLAALQNTANESVVDILDDLKGDYAALQETVTKTESAMEAIALRHPDWFTTKKTIKTPYGQIRLHSSTELEAVNEEASIVRIKLEAQKRHPGDSDAAIAARQKFVSQYVRSEERLNKEALELEDDAFLSIVGIKRDRKQNFSAKPATLDLGKAVKEQVETEAEAA